MTENQSATTNNVIYWRPSAGETMAGIIQGSGVWKNLLFDDQKAMLLQDDSGAVLSVALNRYLMHSLKQNNAAPGDFATVTFHGKEQKSSGRSFNRYSLQLDKSACSA